MDREELILTRIRTENGMVSVCADDYLSMEVKERMLERPWPLPSNQTQAVQQKVVSGENVAPNPDASGFDTQSYVLPPKLGCEADMEEAFQNKDIMWKIPPRTPLRFMKRILNRILRLTNRYQQIFNNAVYRILVILTGTLEWVKDGLAMTDDKANRAIHKTDKLAAMTAQLEQKIQILETSALQKADHQAIISAQLEQRIQSLESYVRQEQMLAQIESISNRIAAFDQTVNELIGQCRTQAEKTQILCERQQLQGEQIAWYSEQAKMQSDKCEIISEHQQLQGKQIAWYVKQYKQNRSADLSEIQQLKNQGSCAADTLSSQNFRVTQAEEKLDKLQNQAQYNSEQLVEQNYRIQSVGRKVERLQYGNISAEGASISGGSFSQSGEDSIVDYIIERFQILPSEVSYLDLGANHAKFLSNTYYFYQRSARGVLVEANPNLIPELEQYRVGDVILNRCVSQNGGEKIRFHITDKDGLSSMDPDAVNEVLKQSPDVHLSDTVDVESITVNELFRSYFNPVPTFVSMDLEGIELDILRSIDFDRYRPLLYIIETIPYHAYLVTEEKEAEIIAFMRSKGYIEYAFTGINSIFIDRTQLSNL